jgi:hypothetical protein
MSSPSRFSPACNVIFTANSGHELGHLGLDDFVARRPGWERPISEGAPPGYISALTLVPTTTSSSLQSASDDLRQLTELELGRAGQASGVVAPKTLMPNGEDRDIRRAGGSYVTLAGSNPLFHLPQDGGPHAVDVTRVAAAAAYLVVKLTRSRLAYAGPTTALIRPSAASISTICPRLRKGHVSGICNTGKRVPCSVLPRLEFFQFALKYDSFGLKNIVALDQ